MRKPWLRLWSVVLFFLMAFCWPAQLAAEPATPPIRVGIVPFSGYYNIDESGNISGYGYDYLQELAKYTGWRYEYVQASWWDALEMLRNGQIDLLGLATYDPNRLTDFAYGSEPAGVAFSSLYVKLDNTRIAYEDYANFNDLKIGLLKGNVHNNYFYEFCQRHQINATTITYPSTPDLIKALQDGEIDASVSLDAMTMPNVKIIAPLSKQPYYFMTKQGNDPLLKDLNEAQVQLHFNTPHFEALLHEKYFSQSALAFTQEELTYIKSRINHPLRVVYDPNYAPIEYYNSNTKTMDGITADVFRSIAAYTGLSFRFIHPDNFSHALEMMKNHDADILTAIDYKVDNSPDRFQLTDVYLTIPSMIIKNKTADQRAKPILVLPKDYATSEKFLDYINADMTMIYAATPEACFDAVASGSADMTYSNLYVTNILLQNYKYRNLTATLVRDYADKLHAALPSTADPLLLSILNKSIHSIGKDRLDTIVLDNTLKHSADSSFSDLLYRNVEDFLLLLACAILLILCIFAYIIVMKNRHNRTIEYLAFVDELTGIWNFNKFKKEAALLLTHSPKTSYAILFLDIAKFKYINNSFGFDIGDNVLRHIASTLAENITIGNIFSRFSADQFVLMIAYSDKTALIEELHKLYHKMQTFRRTASDSYTLSFSCGISLIDPAEKAPQTIDINTALDQAVMAQRTVKGIHGNSYAFYNDAFREQIIKEKNIEDIMDLALDNHEFVVYYQPKYQLSTAEIAGAEALVRWKNPKLGMIYPNDFIPLFEKNGFIINLDFYVLKVLCQDMKKWLRSGYKALPVSVNMSRLHINNPNFPQQLQMAVDECELPHNLIEIEITESAFIENAAQLQKTIIELKKFGFAVSMDDFGSGYSSLNLLKELPFDILKIDKDFFQKGYSTDREQIIIASIVEMSQKLNIKVVAEGVEKAEQIEFLKRINCDMAQGYLFSRPIELTEFLKKMES